MSPLSFANGYVSFRIVRKLNSEITGAYNENITGVRVVKALGREQENLREFGQLSGSMYRAGTERPVSACSCNRSLISALLSGASSGKRRQNGICGITIGGFSLHFIYYFHDVAHSGSCQSIRGNAAVHRICRAHFSLIDSEPKSKTAWCYRSRFNPGRHHFGPCYFLLRR
jgi:ABC-type multidrug transport system fused ATPase/permease subunit